MKGKETQETKSSISPSCKEQPAPPSSERDIAKRMHLKAVWEAQRKGSFRRFQRHSRRKMCLRHRRRYVLGSRRNCSSRFVKREHKKIRREQSNEATTAQIKELSSYVASVGECALLPRASKKQFHTLGSSRREINQSENEIIVCHPERY